MLPAAAATTTTTTTNTSAASKQQPMAKLLPRFPPPPRAHHPCWMSGGEGMEARVSPALIFFQMFYEAKICLRKSSAVGLLVQES
jgi:hypothetical protein